MHAHFRIPAALVALALAACGPATSEETDAGNKVEEGPLFLIHSATQSATGERLNYFTLTDSISKAQTLTYDNSIELPGRPRLYAAKGNSFFAIGDGESPTITRYEVKDGALVKGDSLSLASLGVGNLGAQAVLFVSETKAYYKDDAQAQIIVWNPTSMEIVKTVSLGEDLAKDGLRTSISAWAAREGEAYVTVSWTSSNYDRVEPGVELIRIDTATDALTRSSETRCRGISKTANVDGTLYFFSSVINGLGHAVNGATDGGQADCILRISEGKTAFDTDYLGTLSTALGEGKEGTVITVTEDGEAWAQVADLSITPNAEGTTYNQWYSAGWSWYHIPLATLDTAVQVAGEPGAYSGFTMTSGSSFFVSAAQADYSTSTLKDLSSGSSVDGVTFPGFVLDIAQIR